MNGNYNNNNSYTAPGYASNPGDRYDQNLKRFPLLTPGLDFPPPASEMNAALVQYASGVLPYWATLQFNYSSASQSLQKTLQVDASYYYFIYGIGAYQETGSTDFATSITSIQINTLTNFIQNPIPVIMFSQYTAAPPPFFLVVPASNSLIVTIVNGATAANDVVLTFWGQRVPVAIANKILQLNNLTNLG